MEIKSELKEAGRLWIGALVCCALWGSAFPSVKIGYSLFEIASVDYASQILFAGIRFLAAGVLTILIGSIQEKKPLLPKVKSWSMIIILSVFQTVLQYVLFYVGLANTTAMKGAILNGSSAFFAIVFACAFIKEEKMNLMKFIGCMLGMVGLVVVNIEKGSVALTIDIMGDSFMLLSAISYALSSLLIKIFSQRENTVLLCGYQFLLGGGIMILIGYGCGGTLCAVSFEGMILLGYLALLSSIAYSLWGVLIKSYTISKVSIFGFSIPLFGSLLSMFILQEEQTMPVTYVIALFCVCVGIFMVNDRRNA